MALQKSETSSPCHLVNLPAFEAKKDLEECLDSSHIARSQDEYHDMLQELRTPIFVRL